MRMLLLLLDKLARLFWPSRWISQGVFYFIHNILQLLWLHLRYLSKGHDSFIF